MNLSDATDLIEAMSAAETVALPGGCGAIVDGDVNGLTRGVDCGAKYVGEALDAAN